MVNGEGLVTHSAHARERKGTVASVGGVARPWDNRPCVAVGSTRVFQHVIVWSAPIPVFLGLKTTPAERAAMAQNKIAFALGAAAGATALLAAQRYWRRRRPRPAAAGCVDVNPGFRVEGEEREVYRRFLAVYDRKVVYPDGRVADFDIVGHPRSFHFVCVFVFHTADRSVTLLREFAQAGLPEAALVFGLACGGYDPRKHRSVQHAAESELSEEAQLEGGEWMRLLPADHPGVLEAKW